MEGETAGRGESDGGRPGRARTLLVATALVSILVGVGVALVAASTGSDDVELTRAQREDALLEPSDVGPEAEIDTSGDGFAAQVLESVSDIGDDDLAAAAREPVPDDMAVSDRCRELLLDPASTADTHPLLVLLSAGTHGDPDAAQRFLASGRDQVAHHLAADTGQLDAVAAMVAGCPEIGMDMDGVTLTIVLSEGERVRLGDEAIAFSIVLEFEADEEGAEELDGISIEIAFVAWSRDGVTSQVSLVEPPDHRTPGMAVRSDQERLRALARRADSRLVEVLDGAG